MKTYPQQITCEAQIRLPHPSGVTVIIITIRTGFAITFRLSEGSRVIARRLDLMFCFTPNRYYRRSNLIVKHFLAVSNVDPNSPFLSFSNSQFHYSNPTFRPLAHSPILTFSGSQFLYHTKSTIRPFDSSDYSTFTKKSPKSNPISLSSSLAFLSK